MIESPIANSSSGASLSSDAPSRSSARRGVELGAGLEQVAPLGVDVLAPLDLLAEDLAEGVEGGTGRRLVAGEPGLLGQPRENPEHRLARRGAGRGRSRGDVDRGDDAEEAARADAHAVGDAPALVGDRARAVEELGGARRDHRPAHRNPGHRQVVPRAVDDVGDHRLELVVGQGGLLFAREHDQAQRTELGKRPDAVVVERDRRLVVVEEGDADDAVAGDHRAGGRGVDEAQAEGLVRLVERVVDDLDARLANAFLAGLPAERAARVPVVLARGRRSRRAVAGLQRVDVDGVGDGLVGDLHRAVRAARARDAHDELAGGFERLEGRLGERESAEAGRVDDGHGELVDVEREGLSIDERVGELHEEALLVLDLGVAKDGHGDGAHAVLAVRPAQRVTGLGVVAAGERGVVGGRELDDELAVGAAGCVRRRRRSRRRSPRRGGRRR